MTRKKNIATNAILNVIKTLMSVVFPLITYPYVTRILQKEYLGRVTYAQSIISYFSLFAALGVSTYAVREGAKLRNDRLKLNKFANEVFTTNIVTTIVSYIFLFITIVCVERFRGYAGLLCLISLSIVFTTIGIDWVNVIFEDYFFITIRSFVVQIINLILLFCFVKSESDYYIYAFLTVLSNIIICSWNFVYCRKYIHIHLVFGFNILKHVKSMLVFFANTLAITIYVNADTTMIGWMINDSCVGIYSVAVKVYTILKTVLASVYAVCIPRLSHYYGKGDVEDYSLLINRVLSGLILLLLPLSTGVILLARPIILILAGAEYIDSVLTLQILSIAFFFAIIGGVFSSCINIPMGKEKISLEATILAALSNVILNIFLIPLFKQNGAAITTVIAECIVLSICFLLNKEIKKIIVWKSVFKSMYQSVVGCIPIVIVSYLCRSFVSNDLIYCVVVVILSMVFYVSVLVIMKNKLICDGVKELKNRRRKPKC